MFLRWQQGSKGNQLIFLWWRVMYSSTQSPDQLWSGLKIRHSVVRDVFSSANLCDRGCLGRLTCNKSLIQPTTSLSYPSYWCFRWNLTMLWAPKASAERQYKLVTIHDLLLCMVLYAIALHFLVLDDIGLYHMILHSTALHCIILFGIALHRVVLYCIIWYYMVLEV